MIRAILMAAALCEQDRQAKERMRRDMGADLMPAHLLDTNHGGIASVSRTSDPTATSGGEASIRRDVRPLLSFYLSFFDTLQRACRTNRVVYN
jgi:hypothetical protein